MLMSCIRVFRWCGWCWCFYLTEMSSVHVSNQTTTIPGTVTAVQTGLQIVAVAWICHSQSEFNIGLTSTCRLCILILVTNLINYVHQCSTACYKTELVHTVPCAWGTNCSHCYFCLHCASTLRQQTAASVLLGVLLGSRGVKTSWQEPTVSFKVMIFNLNVLQRMMLPYVLLLLVLFFCKIALPL